MQSQPDTQTNTRQREEHLSSNGQWRSFPKEPNLLQYVSNGNYYGRIKIGGKVIRDSLKTRMVKANRFAIAVRQGCIKLTRSASAEGV